MTSLSLCQCPLLVVEPEELDCVDVFKKVFQNWIVLRFPGIGDLREPAEEEEDDEDGAENQK